MSEDHYRLFEIHASKEGVLYTLVNALMPWRVRGRLTLEPRLELLDPFRPAPQWEALAEPSRLPLCLCKDGTLEVGPTWGLLHEGLPREIVFRNGLRVREVRQLLNFCLANKYRGGLEFDIYSGRFVSVLDEEMGDYHVHQKTEDVTLLLRMEQAMEYGGLSSPYCHSHLAVCAETFRLKHLRTLLERCAALDLRDVTPVPAPATAARPLSL